MSKSHNSHVHEPLLRQEEHGHQHQHHHDHGHHHHHGVFTSLSNANVKLYNAIGNMAGGRAHAGRIGRVSRITRMISNSTAIAIGVAGVVIIGSSVASGGLATPVWLLVIGGVVVAANLGGITLGSGGNHLKISQYYDGVTESHAENSRLLKLLGRNPECLPHGIKEYWQKDRPLFWMTMGRRGQDVVSTTGTVASNVLLLSAVGALAVAPPVAVGLFFASRGLSASAAVGGTMTNRHRLSVYKEVLYRFGQQYVQLTRDYDKEKSDRAFSIVAEVFGKLHVSYNITDIKDAHQWRAFNVGYSLYKMLFTQAESLKLDDDRSFLHDDNRERIVNGIVSELQTMTKAEKKNPSSRYIGRTALRKIGGGHPLSVLDSMPVLAMQMEEKLAADINGRAGSDRAALLANTIIDNLHIASDKDDTHKALAFAIRKAVTYVTGDNGAVINKISVALKPYLKEEKGKVKTGSKWFGLRAVYSEQPLGSWVLDTDKLAHDFPAEGHAHGSNFLPFYHLSQLFRKMAGSEVNPVASEPDDHHHHHCYHHHHHGHDHGVAHHHPKPSPAPVIHREHLRAVKLSAPPIAHMPAAPHHAGNTSHYHELKASIIKHQGKSLTQAVITEQQQKLDAFRQHSTDFILVQQYKDRRGNTVCVWDDPAHRGQAEYRIHYIINDLTKKMAVKYGSKASAIIAMDSNKSARIGVRLMEIAQGKHAVFGDNHNIDMAKSGLHTAQTAERFVPSQRKTMSR